MPACLWLETTTDAEEHFRCCARPDGHIYAMDLTIDQIARLRVFGRLGSGTRSNIPLMHVPTLEELLKLRRHLEQVLGNKSSC